MSIEDLKKNIARIEGELAEMKEQLSRQARNWPATVKRGMLFKHHLGCVFMAARTAGCEHLLLVEVDAEDPGNIWSEDALFNGAEEQFTYIGKAKDLLRIAEGA